MNAIFYWASTYPGDFKARLAIKLDKFLDLVDRQEFHNIIQKIRNLDRMQIYEFGTITRDPHLRLPSPVPIVDKSNTAFNWFQKLDSIAIAEHFTWMEWNMFSCLNARDLVQRATKNTELSPYMDLSIQHFTFMASVVRTLVLIQETPNFRSEIVGKIIEIAVHLRKMNNYHTLMAIMTGLGHKSITRLKQTFDIVQLMPVLKDYQTLKSLVSFKDDFSKYRFALSASSLPCIPYVYSKY